MSDKSDECGLPEAAQNAPRGSPISADEGEIGEKAVGVKEMGYKMAQTTCLRPQPQDDNR